jgi:hypothetical protein
MRDMPKKGSMEDDAGAIMAIMAEPVEEEEDEEAEGEQDPLMLANKIQALVAELKQAVS